VERPDHDDTAHPWLKGTPMTDKTTMGISAEPEEVEAVLQSLCGYHLAERDPVFRYTVLTREQVLYDALVSAIKRERGRALAELVANGHKLTEVAELTGLGTRQRVQRLVQIAKAAEEAVAEVQAASREVSSRDIDERLAAVEATLDEVVSGLLPPVVNEPEPMDLEPIPVVASAVTVTAFDATTVIPVISAVPHDATTALPVVADLAATADVTTVIPAVDHRPANGGYGDDRYGDGAYRANGHGENSHGENSHGENGFREDRYDDRARGEGRYGEGRYGVAAATNNDFEDVTVKDAAVKEGWYAPETPDVWADPDQDFDQFVDETRVLPKLVHPTREVSGEDVPWWRRSRNSGAA
jgi:hypothetical protein